MSAAKGIALLALVVGALLTSAGSLSAANGSWHLSGGGTASISQVAMNVTGDGSGSASGTFNCLMAGRSAFVLSDPAFNLSHMMKVQATVTGGSVSESTSTVTFTGSGFMLADGQRITGIHISVVVDVATQQFTLTVLEVGQLPLETLESGQISLR